MNTDREFDGLLRSWFESAPSREPDGLLESVLAATGSTRPRPRWLVRLSGEPMFQQRRHLNRMASVGFAATAVVVAILIGIGLLVRQPNVGPPTVPSAVPSPQAADPTGSWTIVESTIEPREGHTATRLEDGTVLVAGGASEASPSEASAEIYDPSTGSWALAGPMTASRLGPTATLLPDGRVLVAGGTAATNVSGVGNTALTSAELYDPRTGTWTATAPMAVARRGQTATLLANGTVLVAGGSDSAGRLLSAEIFDPASESWAPTGDMVAARAYHVAVLLDDGTVIVAGNPRPNAPPELYDPESGRWSVIENPAAAAVVRHAEATAALLADGTVLIAGGEGQASAVVYDPASQTFAVTPEMHQTRWGARSTLLPDGSVLITGGSGAGTGAELYDPQTGSWLRAATQLGGGGRSPTATLLPNGTVLVVGTRSSTLYHPGP